MTRLQFLRRTGAAVLGAGSLGGAAWALDTVTGSGRIRVRGVAGEVYKAAFRKLCRTRRFATVDQALHALRGQRIRFELYREA
jgi:hypothetical protein